MPAPLIDETEEPLEALPVLAWWVRAVLVVMAAGLVAVFTLAVLLNPYNPDGTPRTMETHRTWPLNLPPCTFKTMTGLPCPSCGMTTSFSLLMHGDVLNSLRANCVGTVLALFWLALIPWGLISAWRGRPLFVTAIEPVLLRVLIAFLVVLFARWAVVLALIWWAHRAASGG